MNNFFDTFVVIPVAFLSYAHVNLETRQFSVCYAHFVC